MADRSISPRGRARVGQNPNDPRIGRNARGVAQAIDLALGQSLKVNPEGRLAVNFPGIVDDPLELEELLALLSQIPISALLGPDKNFSWNNKQLTGLKTGTQPTHATSKGYVDDEVEDAINAHLLDKHGEGGSAPDLYMVAQAGAFWVDNSAPYRAAITLGEDIGGGATYAKPDTGDSNYDKTATLVTFGTAMSDTDYVIRANDMNRSSSGWNGDPDCVVSAKTKLGFTITHRDDTTGDEPHIRWELLSK